MSWTRVTERDRRGHVIERWEFCPACWERNEANATESTEQAVFSRPSKSVKAFEPDLESEVECSDCEQTPLQLAQAAELAAEADREAWERANPVGAHE